MFYLYILKCSDDYLYTGITNNLAKRFNEHCEGYCPLTKNRGKVQIVYQEEYSDRIDAARREKEIKGWRRSKKEELIKKFTSRRTERTTRWLKQNRF